MGQATPAGMQCTVRPGISWLHQDLTCKSQASQPGYVTRHMASACCFCAPTSQSKSLEVQQPLLAAHVSYVMRALMACSVCYLQQRLVLWTGTSNSDIPLVSLHPSRLCCQAGGAAATRSAWPLNTQCVRAKTGPLCHIQSTIQRSYPCVNQWLTTTIGAHHMSRHPADAGGGRLLTQHRCNTVAVRHLLCSANIRFIANMASWQHNTTTQAWNTNICAHQHFKAIAGGAAQTPSSAQSPLIPLQN